MVGIFLFSKKCNIFHFLNKYKMVNPKQNLQYFMESTKQERISSTRKSSVSAHQCEKKSTAHDIDKVNRRWSINCHQLSNIKSPIDLMLFHKVNKISKKQPNKRTMDFNHKKEKKNSCARRKVNPRDAAVLGHVTFTRYQILPRKTPIQRRAISIQKTQAPSLALPFPATTIRFSLEASGMPTRF